MGNLMIKFKKGSYTSTIECKDKDHYNRLKKRFSKKGYTQIPYVKEEEKETYPF